MSTRIYNAANTPLNLQAQGTTPDVSGAMLDRYQPMTFVMVSTSVQGYQALQVGSAIDFQGNIQPFSARQLQLRPEGQRAWKWFWVHSILAVPLSTDDVISYHGVQYRVMAEKDQTIYGHWEYQLVQDYTGSGPVIS